MKSLLKGGLAVAIAASLMLTQVAGAVDKVTTEKEKASYMVGMDIANGVRQIKDEIDVEIMIQGLRTALAGGKTLLTEAEAQTVRGEFQTALRSKMEAKQKAAAESNKVEGEKFLAANKSKPGIKSTASGLQYQVIKQGTGAKPGPTSMVKVHYTGTLIDGTKFDSSVDRGTPAEFALNGVIPGWTEALQLMPAGSKYKLFIPSALGYGETGTPGIIGPNATLIFDVELLEVAGTPAAAKQ
ncbi:hypothetical protein C7S18_11755 [Ahniella affigens]|uniref:Peptidyl-prolyl cis-trans isomerase n=1 Tax=Ahniella affigens TaxID=2021234 RepID=A0A2P1PSM0_9GAMM|nr:FKBP-type peptidyl-prolyl cis-trans isomerase [Ahniella affigens]AVP97830.1 hypothetical protein C7S18_11755 [Ahniella affigens]